MQRERRDRAPSVPRILFATSVGAAVAVCVAVALDALAGVDLNSILVPVVVAVLVPCGIALASKLR